MTREDANMAVARRALEEIWNRGDLAVADELCSPEIVCRSPVMSEPMRGVEALKEYVIGFRTGLPDVELTIDDMIAAGDIVAFRWHLRGTHLGELSGIPPTGRRVEVNGADYMYLAEGRVRELWLYPDVFNIMRQIGMIPSPEGGLRSVLRAISLGIRSSPRPKKAA